MRAAAVKLTPLTEQEAAFAEANHDIVWRFLNHYRLSHSEHYDIVIFGYLQAVKKWHARDDLHRHPFGKIAWNSMRNRVGNEQRERGKQIRTVSLEAVVPGTENFTLGSIITEENIRFLGGEEEPMGMRISYDEPVPEIAKMSGSKSVEIETLLGFLDSAHKTMCLEYGDKKEAVKKVASLRGWKKNHKREDFELYRFEDRIYIEKVPESKKRQKIKED